MNFNLYNGKIQLLFPSTFYTGCKFTHFPEILQITSQSPHPLQPENSQILINECKNIAHTI